MKKQTPYLTQYCNMSFEWHIKGINSSNASENQIIEMQNLREKAIEQSGLTCNELTLIIMCRKYGIFTKVNVYAHKIKH